MNHVPCNPNLTVTRQRWKLLQILPYLLESELKFSSAFIAEIEKVNQLIPIKNGKAKY